MALPPPAVSHEHVDLGGNPLQGELQIRQLCTRVLPGWGSLDASALQVGWLAPAGLHWRGCRACSSRSALGAPGACCACCSWAGAPAPVLLLLPQVHKMSGGISNLLVKVAPPAGTPGLAPVAVKVFGQKTELLIDRKAELEMLLRLNAAGFGAQAGGGCAARCAGGHACGAPLHTPAISAAAPQLQHRMLHPQVLAVFDNGRIEAFMTAYTLTPQDMRSPAFVPRIARRLRWGRTRCTATRSPCRHTQAHTSAHVRTHASTRHRRTRAGSCTA